MRAFIVANGYVEEGEQYGAWVAPGDLVVAADGGAAVALRLGLKPQVVVGDMDSLSPQLRAQLEEQACAFVVSPRRKDETDTELAIRYALQQGADDLVLLGTVGDRLDHTLANVLLLGMPELHGVKAKVVSHGTELWLARDTVEIQGHVGDTVTLLPLGGDAVGVTTEGLEYALRDDTLRFGPARGVSNAMTAPTARVALRGGLLWVLKVEGEAVEARSESDLTEVYRAQGHLRANVIKSKLEAAGIQAILSYDSASVVFGLTVDGIGEVRVLVRDAQAEEARRVLAEEGSLEGEPGL